MQQRIQFKGGENRTLVVNLTVNGKPVQIEVSPLSRLSEVLRDRLQLTGTKVGCHAGDCGACTVLLDDEQICSCMLAVAQCEGRSVTTVEGLSSRRGELSELQRGFIAGGAAQCGICTPGMLMAAEDILRRHPDPTAEQVLDGLAGVLCRCTGYQKIVEAVLAVAKQRSLISTLASAPAQRTRAVGARLDRLDAHAKVTGQALFGADTAPANALWMRVLRSPHARASFSFGDLDSFVVRHPGITGLVHAGDIPNNRFAIFADLRDQPALAELRVRMRGEAILAVVGTQPAIEALDLTELPVRWTVEPAVTEISDSLQQAANGGEPIQTRWPDNVLCRGRVVRGDVDSESAAIRLTAEMSTAYVEHAYIEPEAGYAEWHIEQGVERVHVFACTQTPYMDRDEIAAMFALAPEQVRIIPSAVGGGFGGKLDISIQPLLVAAARKFRVPVRIVYSRPESMVSTTKRHPALMRATLSAADDGALLAYDFSGDFNTGAYSSWGPTVANRVPIHASGPYRIRHIRALTRAVLTNNANGGAFRGFGVPQSTLINELLIDQMAERQHIDPLEFRIKHALRAGDHTATGQLLSASVGLLECLNALKTEWPIKRQLAQQYNELHRDGLLRRGVGIACMWYGIGNTVIANPSSMTLALQPDGRFLLHNGAVDIGQGTYTIMVQIAADALGVPVDFIDQTSADTDLTRDAGKSSASRQTFVSGNAARLAAEDLRGQLLRLLGATDDAQIDIDDGLLMARSACELRSIKLADLSRRPDGYLALGEGYFNPPTIALDADGQGVPYATYGFAAQFAEVEVDITLGTVRVLSVHAAHDVGRAINPTQVEGQIHGGIAQGLGLALMEEYVSGRTDNLHDYLIPTVGDMPQMITHLIEDPEPLGPYGAKGVGEPALVATAPAILNAIYHAAGVRMMQVPATPDRVLAALRELRS